MDATTTQLYLAKSIALTDDAKLGADVDVNSDINIIDTTLIQLYLANKTVSGSSCGEYLTGGSVIIDPTQKPTENIIPDGKNYIYYYNSDNWGTVMAYCWSDANSAMMSWPGQSMESIGNNVYRYEVPADATMIIFNDNNGKKTDDLTIPGFGQIYKNGSWSDYAPGPGPDPVNGNFIYFKNNNNWSEVCAYYWSDSNTQMTTWPGQSMESVGNGVYRIELPADATKIVFNDRNNKTDDLTLEGFNKIYDNGSWSQYNG